MPSANYRLFEQAMRMRKPIFCMYNGYPRAVCPIVLGHSQSRKRHSPFSSAVKASRACRRGVSGAAFHCRRSPTPNLATARGERAPATPSRKAASRSSISM